MPYNLIMSKPDTWSSRVFVTDGVRVAVPMRRDNGKPRVFETELNVAESIELGASRAFKDTIGSTKSESLRSQRWLPGSNEYRGLPNQDDAENTAFWSLLFVTPAFLNLLEGEITENESRDTAQILLTDISKIEEVMTDSLWLAWWNDEGKQAILDETAKYRVA